MTIVIEESDNISSKLKQYMVELIQFMPEPKSDSELAMHELKSDPEPAMLE